MSTPKFYRTKKFIETQNEWYDRLTSSGFSDLEWLDQKTGRGQSTPFLKDSCSKFRHLDVADLTDRVEYFQLAQDFTSSHKFSSRLHKFIWHLYTQGVSYRNMIPMIRSRGFKYVPSIFWISTHLTKLKRAFILWQLDQPDKPETLAQFMEDNRGV